MQKTKRIKWNRTRYRRVRRNFDDDVDYEIGQPCPDENGACQSQ